MSATAEAKKPVKPRARKRVDTVGDNVVTVRHVPPEVTRRAMRAILDDPARRRGPRIDVVKQLRTARESGYRGQ